MKKSSIKKIAMYALPIAVSVICFWDDMAWAAGFYLDHLIKTLQRMP